MNEFRKPAQHKKAWKPECFFLHHAIRGQHVSDEKRSPVRSSLQVFAFSDWVRSSQGQEPKWIRYTFGGRCFVLLIVPIGLL